MFRPYDQQQVFPLPPSLSDFLDEDPPAHAIDDIVDRLDLSRLENRYGDGMETPAFKTFIEFRTRHRSDMKMAFAQTVKVARELDGRRNYHSREAIACECAP